MQFLPYHSTDKTKYSNDGEDGDVFFFCGRKKKKLQKNNHWQENKVIAVQGELNSIKSNEQNGNATKPSTGKNPFSRIIKKKHQGNEDKMQDVK